MCEIVNTIQHVWLTPGVSEFVAALIGGGFAIAAQQLASRQDRKKEQQRSRDAVKGHAWAIFFKLSQINEALTNAYRDIQTAQKQANDAGVELWQYLQFPPHDWREIQWDNAELVLLIDHKHFDLLTRYQEATMWLSNFVQSSQFYRELRLEFLRSQPSKVMGDQGVMAFDQAGIDAVMPTIVHLRSLASSLSQVIASQQPDARKLLVDYVSSMKAIIGHQPQLEFLDEAKEVKA